MKNEVANEVTVKKDIAKLNKKYGLRGEFVEFLAKMICNEMEDYHIKKLEDLLDKIF